MTDYLEIKIEVNPLYSEFIGELLVTYNCNEVVLSEELFLDSLPESKINYVKAYLPKSEENEDLILAITSELLNQRILFLKDNVTANDLGSWNLTFKVVNEKDWSENWKKYWHPQRIGKHVDICPSWENYAPESKDDIIIRLDPGTAFGTGTHPTTRLCLKVIEDIFSNNKKALSVLDVGTGSGILAIAAAKMGAKKVTGIDIDPVTLEVSIKNAEINSVSDICQFDNLSIRYIEETYDLVIANILAKTIISMSKDIKRVTNKSGILILSGLISSTIDNVTEHFESLGYKLLNNESEENWYAMIFKKVVDDEIFIPEI